MPPEQLSGAEIDHRGDIFSLGAILYEMTTGRPAFAGNDAQKVIAAILHEQPPSVREHRADVPALLERVVCKCMNKRRSRRWQSAGDLSHVLSWIAEAESDT